MPFPEQMLVDLFPSVMQRVRVLDIGFYACKDFILFSLFLQLYCKRGQDVIFSIIISVLSVVLVEFFLKCFPNLEELNVEGTKTVIFY